MEMGANVNRIEPRQSSWLASLTPRTCRILLSLLLLAGIVIHVAYLRLACPFDLTGDEVHYWDCSRQLDLSYYSKGPAVAYIIRASCAVFGEHAWAVRLPATLFAAGAMVGLYWLAKTLYRDERLALGAVLLCHAIPLFVAGSLLMTIDAPFVFCWSMATALAAVALFDGRRWPWPLIGLCVGAGFLAKYSMYLWFVGLLVFALIDRRARRELTGWGLWVAVLIAAACATPVVVWNSRHHWVSLQHVSQQTGSTQGQFSAGEVSAFLGSQVGVIGPILFVLMVIAVVAALRRPSQIEPERRAERFLITIGLTFFALVLITAFRHPVQPNWAAPAYITLILLLAAFLARCAQSPLTWRPIKPWFWAAVIMGGLAVIVSHEMQWLYPGARAFGLKPRVVDPTVKFRGYQELGLRISDELEKLAPGAIIICEDYQTASEMAFYVRGQPKTFCIGPYLLDPRERHRLSQFDMWPDRDLDQPALRGRDVIFIGHGVPAELRAACSAAAPTSRLDIKAGGLTIRSFQWWSCHHFGGLSRPGGGMKF